MQKQEIQDSKALIQSVREDGMKALESVYRAFRGEFLGFGRRFQVSDADILDAFQDAIIAFYENVMEGKIEELGSSVKTYIFSIGKYQLLNKLKRDKRTVDEIESSMEFENPFQNKFHLTHQQTMMKSALDNLGKQCQRLILLFYYRRFSIEAIMHEMNYSNENTVKANKSRCMKSLKEVVKNQKIT